MNHAILGAGGVGGFVGAILASAGDSVTLLLRRDSLAAHPDSLTLESPLGKLNARVARADTLREPVDVLWITTKATQLDAALGAVPDGSLARAITPLLNGIDHVALLRERFPGTLVVPGTIAGEFERTAPGHIAHRTPFARLAFGSSGRDVLAPAVPVFERFGCEVKFIDNEASLLWRKLVLLAPFALATSAAQRPIGAVRDDPAWRERLEGAAREACAVAAASGADVDMPALLKSFSAFPATMRSSMQKDLAAGNPLELDAIAGPILRGGKHYGIPVPFTASLAQMFGGVISLE